MPLASRTGEVKYRMKGEPGADAYMITTSVSQIYQNMSGSFNPSTFRCYGYQGKSPATGMYLQVWGSSDNQNWTYITYRQLTAGNNYLDVSVESDYKYYIVRMYDHNPSTDIDAELEFFASATISVIKDGEPGAQGNPGAKMRMRKWTSGTYYMRGSGSEEWYDIVEYNNRLYLCMVSHTSSSYNSPISGTGHWEIAQNWTFIATKLLLAEKITADMINADGITAKNVDITGKITATSGSFTGEIIATSGSIGGIKIENGYIGTNYSNRGLYISNDMVSVRFSKTIARIGYDVGNIFTAGNMAAYFSCEETPSVSGVVSTNVGVNIYVKGANAYDNAVHSGNHALYILKGDICGFRLRTRRVNASMTLDKMDSNIVVVKKDITLTLPTSDVEDGQMYFIRNHSDGNVRINGRVSALDDPSITGSYVDLGAGYLAILMYDKVNNKWLANRCDNW